MADAPVFPQSYKDPLYASLDASHEQKLGLPDGLLTSVRENGEKSNADQVSSAGGKTPYQITPTTRDLALKKWGIDAYLNPQNASEVAGLLLKDSLDRNHGDPAMAATEYIGGTDPKNWGPQTKSYVTRVMQGVNKAQSGADSSQKLYAFPQPPDLGTLIAHSQLSQAPGQLQALYDARMSGKMSPQDAAEYDADVQSGRMMLPRGASLPGGAQPGVGGAVAGADAPALPPGVLQAYQSGQMAPQDAKDFEHDVRQGAWQLPQGVTPDALFGPVGQPTSMMGRLADTVTGNARRTPTTDALPDWAGMPEMNDMSMAGFKAGLGTLMSNPKETAQVIQANFPGVQMRQDEKGNFILKSSVNGQEYAIKPGFQMSDIPRAAAGALAFTPAGRAETVLGAGVKAGATQAAIEGAQAATGGTFDSGEVATAALLGGAVPAAGRVLSTAAAPVKTLIDRVMGRAEPAVADARAAATPGGAAEAGAPPVTAAPAAPVPPVQSTVGEVAQTAAKAGQGQRGAAHELAAMASPDPETAAAADRLGIGQHLQPDHVTTNDGFRQVVGVLKSNPTSQLALAEKEGLSKVAQRASSLIDEVGGTSDLSQLDQSVKARMQAAHTELSTREDKLYQQLRETIGPTTEAPADNALAFAEQRARDLGGAQNLSPLEKSIVAKLSPKGGEDAQMLEALGPAAKQQALEQGAGAVKQPTYALLDDVRRDVGAAARQAGPFKDADTGLAKKYYALLSQDQGAVAQAAGAGDLAQAAKAATTVRKGMEDDLASLFGKRLDQSLVPALGGAMKSASAGDASKLLAVLKATPDSMKQEVVASGLATVFRNAATRGQINFTGYAKWYDALQRNKQAFAAVMANLPPAARAQLADLARVSKGISDSLSARIKTGLRSSVLDEMKAPDSLASRLFDIAKHAGKGMAVDAVGGHGAGLAMGLFSALKGGAKPNALKAIDEMLTSTEFQHLAATAGTAKQAQTASAFAYSKPFTKFTRAVGNPRELTNREKWVLRALETHNSQN